MNQNPADDEARDAHLLAALQHAPDRDVAPPAALSAAILRRAQAAAQPPRVRWWAALDRLWRPAPMAAFGTVAMATLIGILWSGQDPPEATPSLRRQPGAAAPVEASPGPAAAAVQAPPTSPQAPVARPAATPPARPPGPTALRVPPQEARAQAESAAADAAAIAPPSPPPQRHQEPTAMAAPAPERAAAKSMADAAPAAPAARARSQATGAALGVALASAASPLNTLTVELDAAARSDAARVVWRVAPGQAVVHGAPQRDWWAALVRATQGAWQRDAGRATDAPRVELQIDGVPRGSLVFEPAHVVWREAGGQAWRAPVAADTLREWQEAVARW